MADQFETVTAITAAGTIMGTLLYMSPEQLQSRSLDARSDVFSLGVIFYQMITGVHPFRKASSMESATAIMKDPVLPLSRYCPRRRRISIASSPVCSPKTRLAVCFGARGL